jgi:ABC-type nitrate/sulfonate/bicarbonate transport system substrate-binding protein
MRRSTIAVIILVLVIIITAIFLMKKEERGPTPIRYGISPFQDTAMPVVAEGMGLYKQNNLSVELITVAWEDIIPSLASAQGTIDIGIGSINLFLPRAENINVVGGGDVIFYFPFYVFKGASLMMQKDSNLISMSEYKKRYPNDINKAIAETIKQIQGLRIGLPEGTPYEQMLLAAMKISGMDYRKDIDLRHVKLSDGLPAFLSGDLDLVGAGVTQRTEAMRYGHKVFMDMESLGFAEIIGIVTTEEYAQSHQQELKTLIEIWFESIDSLMSDVDKYSESVLSYLAKTASTKYTLEEYKTALTFQEFPRSIDVAYGLLIDSEGKFYWKRTWDIVNSYLVETNKIKNSIPYEYFWGEEIYNHLSP